MKKIELLSPVGDFECLKAAVQNGADSVYFGAANFNARASATNFDLTNLKEAISYAKLRGVNTHLTLNTLIKDTEFEDAVLLAKKAYEFGIDAIIVQDLGLARFLIKNFPDLPIHASTQMTIHNLEGALEAQKLGFKRVVLSRELSLEEIQYICANTNIEIETFIHGALCISYSGQCLFSSMIGGRSGNRGKCAGPCRLPYEAIATFSDASSTLNASHKKLNSTLGNTSIASKGYLLSTKDLCGLEFLPKLIDAGVMCFKIEGRMKTPEYVATVTRIYRKYIDLALSDKPYVIDKKDIKDLMQVFNRGGFSTGHLDSKANTSLVFPEKPNNMGIYIGNIANLKPNKGHVFINLTDDVSIGDTIEFEKESTKYTVSELMIKNKNITTGFKKQLVEVGRMKGNLHIGDKVYKTNSKELSTFAHLSYQEEHKKVDLTACITLKKNSPVLLNVSTLSNTNPIFDDISVSLSSDILPVEAKSQPLDKDRVISQLNKTKDTIFTFKDIDVVLDDNLFLPSIKVLNELRRNALDEILLIANSRILRKSPILPKFSNAVARNNIEEDNVSINVTDNFSNNIATNSNIKKEISVLLNILDENNNYNDLKNVDNVYIPLKYFGNKKYENTIKNICENFNAYIYLPTIIKSNYTNLLHNVIDNSIETFKVSGFVVSNISNGDFIHQMKSKYNDRFKFIGNYTLNIYNNKSIQEWKELGINRLTISPELDKTTIDTILSNSSVDQELIVYGRTPLMSMNYCLLGKTNKCYPTCGTQCKSNSKYYLKDRLGFLFPIIPDSIQTVSTLYNSKITSICAKDFANVASYRIDLLDETIDNINNIVNAVLAGSRLEGKDYTNGNLNREI